MKSVRLTLITSACIFLIFAGTASAVNVSLATTTTTTTTTTDPAIEALEKEVLRLMKIIVMLRERLQNTGPAQNTSVMPIFDRTLSLGAEGADVSELQEFLAQYPDIYPEGMVTGYFGSLTQRAVQRFQEKHGILPSSDSQSTGYGVVGPKTIDLINTLITKQNERGNTISTTTDNSSDTVIESDTIEEEPRPRVIRRSGGGGGGGGGGSSDTTAPSISSIATSSVAASTVTVSWNTDESADSKVTLSATSGAFADSALLFTESSYVTSHSMEVTGLSPSTTYYFIVTSGDASGNTATSSEYTFFTEVLPLPVISGVGSSSVSTSTATIQWTTDIGADSRVRYATVSGNATTSGLTEFESAQVTSHSVLLGSLATGTTYYFIVISNADGRTATSTEYSFTTLATTSSSTILTISSVGTSGVSTSSATILWTTNIAANSVVKYATTSGNASTSGLIASNGSLVTSHSMNLTGLLASTTYYYIVTSASASSAATSSEYTFETSSTSDDVMEPFISYTGQITGFNDPAGMAVHPNGNLYVADYHNDRVQVLDPSLSVVQTLTGMSEPWDIAFDSSGKVYVTDTNNHRVNVFDASGGLLSSFDTIFSQQGIVISPSDVIYVSGDRVEVYNTSGIRLTTWALGQNYYPRNIAIDSNDRIILSNFGSVEGCCTYDTNHFITIQDTSNVFINKIDLNSEYQPLFVDVDMYDNIWVADHMHDDIHIYTSDGNYIKTIDMSGSGPWNPVGVEIHNNKLYVSDQNLSKIEIFDITY